jgi:hypothetical protein
METKRTMIQDLMNDTEKARYSKFWHKHSACPDSSAIGGKISVEITPTGLGEIFVMKCKVCGARKNITDFDCW